MKKRGAAILTLAVFMFIFGLRWVNLGADPPKNLSSSMGYYSDPGGYVHNARNKILFGQWETDKWNHMYTSPIPHFATYLMFLIFGIGIAQMNAVPALFSCLLLVILYFVLKNTLNRTYALLGVFLLGSNYIFTAFSQIAVRVMPMLLFVVLALYFLARKQEIPKFQLFLAGAMCFLAFATKGTFLLVLPAVFLGLAFFIFFQGSRKLGKPVLALCFFCLGMAAVMILWMWLIFIPQRETFMAFGESNLFWLTHGYDRLLQVFWFRPLFYFMDMPVLTCLASLMLLFLAYRALTAPRKLALLSWVSGFWMISNMVYYSVIEYRAARHFVPLVLPIVLLAVQALYDFSRSDSLKRPQRRPFLFFAFAYFWFIYAISSFVIFISRPVSKQTWSSSLYLVLVLSLVATLLMYLIFRFWPQKRVLSLPQSAKVFIFAFLVLFSFAFNFRSTLNWRLSPRWDRQHISQDLGKAFSDIRMGGLVSMVLALENTHPAHAYKTDYINRGLDFLEKYNITHLLLTTHAEEIPGFYNDFPQVMKGASILARYPLWQTHVVLFDLFPKESALEETKESHQGEVFFGENGIPRYDADASGKLAFVTEVRAQGTRLELPLEEYPAGLYHLTYRLKAASLSQEDVRLSRIDVTAGSRQRALVQRDLYARDFGREDTYQDFVLEFRLSSPQQLNLRLYSTGKAALWFDSVLLTRVGDSHSPVVKD